MEKLSETQSYILWKILNSNKNWRNCQKQAQIFWKILNRIKTWRNCQTQANVVENFEQH